MNVSTFKSGLNMTISIQMLMQGKEVGSIIGKKGESIKRIREESGAWIKISDGIFSERTITVTGTDDAIFKAFTMIITKLEASVIRSMTCSTEAISPLVTIKLVVPPTQLSFLTGEDGSRMREICECSGANVLVSGDMVASTSQQAVTISGSPHCVSECVKLICQAMLEMLSQSLERSVTTLSYQHMPASSPLSYRSGAHYLEGVSPPNGNFGQHSISSEDPTKLNQAAKEDAPSATMPSTQFSKTDTRPPEVDRNGTGFQTPLMSIHEFAIPNYLIGSIIGYQGANINEIRRVSGALIKISNPVKGCSNRLITITGFPDSVQLAQFLIRLRVSSWMGRWSI